MKYALTTLAVLSGLAVTAFAAPQNASPAPKAAPAALVCPVTGEKIASVSDAAGKSTYKGKTYYFCCSGCKPMFDKAPSKYVKSASAKTKTPTVKPSPKA